MASTLLWRRWSDCPPAMLIEAAAGTPAPPDGEALALVYAPRFCAFGRLRGGRLSGPPGFALADGAFHDAVLAEAYEMRLFTAAWEARWLRHGQTGQAALLWDGETGSPPPWTLAAAGTDGAVPIVDTLPRQYLLWGKRDDARSGDDRTDWTALTAARIGTLWAPIAPGPAERRYVVLQAREYLEREEDHGNVVVREQRLTGLAHYMPVRDDEEAA